MTSEEMTDCISSQAYRGRFAGREAVLVNAPTALALEALRVLARTDPLRYAVAWHRLPDGKYEYLLVTEGAAVDVAGIGARLADIDDRGPGYVSFKLNRQIAV